MSAVRGVRRLIPCRLKIKTVSKSKKNKFKRFEEFSYEIPKTLKVRTNDTSFLCKESHLARAMVRSLIFASRRMKNLQKNIEPLRKLGFIYLIIFHVFCSNRALLFPDYLSHGSSKEALVKIVLARRGDVLQELGHQRLFE